MDKKIGLTIEIDGIQDTTKRVVQLEQEIENLNKQLKNTEKGSDEYLKLRQRIDETKAGLRDARKEQRDFIKQANDAKFGEGSYRELNNQLAKARKAFKELSKAEREGAPGKELLARIKSIDTELKEIDAGIGQYQRNVGNYRSALDGLGNIAGGALGDFAGLLNPATLGVGALAAAAGAAANEILEVEKRFSALALTASKTTGLVGSELDDLIVKSEALAQTFGEDTTALIGAQNTLIKEFGLSAAEAGEVLEAGFLSAANAQGDLLDSVREYSTQIREAGGTASDLVGILALSNQEGIFSDKGIDAVKEFGLRIREQSAGTQQALTDAFGVEFSEELFKGFNDGSLSSVEALQKVATELKTLDNASKAQSVISNIFGGAGEDAGRRFIEQLGDAKTELKDLVDQTNPAIAAQQRQLRLNEELAAAQKELADAFAGSNAELSGLGTQTRTFATRVLIGLTDALRPLFDTFKQIGGQLADFIGLFRTATGDTESFTSSIQGAIKFVTKFSTVPLRLLSKALGVVIGLFNQFTAFILSFADDSGVLGDVFRRIQSDVTGLVNIFMQLPAIFDGVVEATKQLGRNLVSFFTTTFLDAQIFAAKVKGVFGAAVAEQIEDLRRQRKAAVAAGGSVAEAYSRGFNASLARDRELESKRADSAAKEEAKKAAERQRQVNSARLKAQSEAQKKYLENQKKFAAEQLQIELALSRQLVDLQARLIDEQIKNIEDEQTRRIATINNAFDDERAAFAQSVEDLRVEAAKREEALIATFGAGSKQVEQARINANEQIRAIEEEQTAILAELEKQRSRDIQAVRDELNMKRIEEAKKQAEELRALRDEQLSEEIGFIRQLAAAQRLERETEALRQLAATTDLKERERIELAEAERATQEELARIRSEFQALQDQEEFLQGEQGRGVQIAQSEFDAIAQARAELNNRLAELEADQTAKAIEEGKKRAAARQQQLEKIAADALEVIGAINLVFEAGDQKEEQRIEEAQARSADRNERLNSELENAVGLRRRFLQQQIDAEEEQQQKLAKQQEQLEKEQAERAKRIALTQAVIQGFLAVQRALASPPGFPFNLPQVGSVIALQGANIAAIASQKFQDGGEIVGPSHSAGGVPFAVNGALGFEAEGGEYIVNKAATARFKPLLEQINSVKFAQGGMIGGVSPTPSIGSVLGQGAEQARALNERTEAIRESQQNIRVVLSTDDLARDQEEVNRITKRTELI